LKEDLGCSAVQLTRGSSVGLSGQFFETISTDDLTPFEYFDRLSNFITSLHLTPPRPVAAGMHAYIDPGLRNAEFVFVRNDPSRPPFGKSLS